MTTPASQHDPQSSGAIDRRPGLPYADFVREYLYPHRPVLVPGAVSTWPALHRWTPEFFRQQFGDRVLKLEKEYRVAELADLIEHSSRENPAPYLHAQHLKHTFPELLPDIEPLPAYLFPQWLDDYYVPVKIRERLNDHSSAEIFFGGKDAGFPFLHYDDLHYHAFSVQIYGQKRFYLYPPEQTPNVYPFPDKPNFSQVRDVEHPDLTQFPHFADTRPFTFVIEPGDLLFVPCGWWHTTKMLSPSISISISHMNDSNWTAFCDDLCTEMRPFHPKSIAVFRGVLGVQGWWKKLRDRVFR